MSVDVIPTAAKPSAQYRLERSAHTVIPAEAKPWHTCHPDRSEAKWRDLLFDISAILAGRNKPVTPVFGIIYP
jgi:hypothetical protein